MDIKHIEEGNELIARFMGWRQFVAYEILDQWESGDACGGEELSEVWILNPTKKFLDLEKKYFGFNIEHKIFDCETESYYEDWHYGFSYDSDWNHLMSVVDKIESLGYDSRIHGNDSDGGCLCDFVDEDNLQISCIATDKNKCETKKEAVFMAVVEFIKYYNNEDTEG